MKNRIKEEIKNNKITEKKIRKGEIYGKNYFINCYYAFIDI
jgi:hypothetical protein